ncbi:MAG: hypothetical protein ACFFCD_07700 [Promethearchaeota archaeon]
MNTSYKMSVIIPLVFVLFLFILLPGNATDNSSDVDRTITLYPRISDTSFSNQGYVSAFQTSTTTSFSTQSAVLYIGTSGTIYDSHLIENNDNNYHQISSQDFNTITANDRVINVNGGYEDGYNYQETNVYDGTSHIMYPHRDYAAENVTSEFALSGTTDDLTKAQILDGTFENITEENIASGGEGWPFGQGSLDTSGETSTADLFFEDQQYYYVSDYRVMHIDTWFTGNINGEIKSVELWTNYTTTSRYNGDRYIQFRKAGGTLYPTDIQPKRSEYYVRQHYNLTQDVTFNNIQELQNLEVIFYHDNWRDYVAFDRLWLEVTVSTTEYVLNVEQDITSLPTADAYELWIYGNCSSEVGDDPINVEVKVNGTLNEWDTLGAFQCESSPGWNVYPLNKSRHLLGAGQDTFTIRYSDTQPDGIPTTVLVDVVEVRTYSDPASYDLDMYYIFNWAETGNEKNISIYDVRSGNQDIDLYIRDFDGNQWVSLSPNATFIEGDYTNHTYLLSSNIGSYISGTNEIWIRYNETDSSNSASLNVDYLGVNIHSVTGINQQTDIVYDFEDFPGDRTAVTQIRVHDSSFVNDSSASIEVQLFDYTNYQWVSCFNINETTETSHTATFSSSPSNFISSNPGNIQIRYVFNDNMPVILNLDYLQVDITYTSQNGGDGGGGGDRGDDSGDGGGGGSGGETSQLTLSASIVYPEEIEKYCDGKVDVILTDEEGSFVSNANVSLTLENNTDPLSMIEKEDYYTILIDTDNLDTGNYTFTVYATRSGYKDFISSAFPFKIIVSYPFLTVIQHPSYFLQLMENPTSLLLDPTFYIIPSLILFGIILQVTTFAQINPKKLHSIYIFTPGGHGIYYRSFGRKGVDSQLMSAALSGIVSLVMEATQSEKPTHTIDQKTFDIFLEYGSVLTVALFVEKGTLNKRKIRNAEKRLVESIEKKYEKILVNWNGDLSFFYELDQLVFDTFDFRVTKDLKKLIFDAAKVQESLVALYASQEKYHICGVALWNAYDLYAKINSPRKCFILESWKALEKAFLGDLIPPKTVLQHKLLKLFFALLDLVKTPWLLKILFKIRVLIYPEVSKELYYFIPPEKISERIDERI